MAEYQKYMFDNFVLPLKREKVSAAPKPEPEPEAVQLSETMADAEVETAAAEPVPVVPETAAQPVLDPEPEPLLPPEPTFSQQELDAAAVEAEQRGYQQGFAAAQAENAAAREQTLKSVEARLQELIALRTEALQAGEQEAFRIALAAVRKLLPSFEAAAAKKELEAFLSGNFAKFRGEKSLSFSFHPDMAAEIAPILSKLAEKNDFEGKIAVHKEAGLGLTDCRVEWKDGGVEKNAEKLLDKMETLIAQ